GVLLFAEPVLARSGQRHEHRLAEGRPRAVLGGDVALEEPVRPPEQQIARVRHVRPARVVDRVGGDAPAGPGGLARRGGALVPTEERVVVERGGLVEDGLDPVITLDVVLGQHGYPQSSLTWTSSLRSTADPWRRMSRFGRVSPPFL